MIFPRATFSRICRAFLKGGDLNPGERHSRDTRDDGTVTLCTLRAATVLSRDCRADFGRPLTKKVVSHSRDGPGVRAPLRTNIVPLTRVWNTPPPLPLTPLKKSPNLGGGIAKSSGVPKRVVSKSVVLADVPQERKPERGYIRMFPRNENRNEGTFAKTQVNFAGDFFGGFLLGKIFRRQKSTQKSSAKFKSEFGSFAAKVHTARIFLLSPSESIKITSRQKRREKRTIQEWPRQTKPKKGQFMNFSRGHSGTKVQCESCLFSQGKTPEFTKWAEFMNF